MKKYVAIMLCKFAIPVGYWLVAIGLVLENLHWGYECFKLVPLLRFVILGGI